MRDKRPMDQLLTEETVLAGGAILGALALHAGAPEDGTAVEVADPLDPLAFVVAVMLESRPDMIRPRNMERGAEAFGATVFAMCTALRSTREMTGKSFLEAMGGHVAPVTGQDV